MHCVGKMPQGLVDLADEAKPVGEPSFPEMGPSN